MEIKDEERFEFDPDEVIIVSHGKGVTIYNAIGRKTLTNYQVTNIPPKCLAALGDDYFISGSSNLPEIKIWNVRDEMEMTKHPCGIVSALATTTCGTYCVAAFKNEIRIWNVLNGEMLFSFVTHHQDITCLRFTSDDGFFISGSKDGFVKVWVLSSMISVNNDPEKKPALYTWNHHTKEVTDIFISPLGSRVATSSMDMTCKVHELETGILLSTVSLDNAVTAVIMDPLAYYLIVGTEVGKIHKINLYYEQPTDAHCNTTEQEGYTAHMGTISCLSITFLGDKFLSASTDGLMKIWITDSFMQIFESKSYEDPLQNAFFSIGPSSLFRKHELSMIPKPLQRCFIPRNQRNPRSFSMPMKFCDRDLSKFSVEDTIDVPPIPGIALCVPKPQQDSTVLDPSERKEIFQQVLLGESMDEVKEMNAQLYTYVMTHVHESMDQVEHADRKIGDN